MTRRPDKAVANHHRLAMALLGLAPDDKVREALKELPTSELPSTPLGDAERQRRGVKGLKSHLK